MLIARVLNTTTDSLLNLVSRSVLENQLRVNFYFSNK